LLCRIWYASGTTQVKISILISFVRLCNAAAASSPLSRPNELNARMRWIKRMIKLLVWIVGLLWMVNVATVPGMYSYVSLGSSLDAGSEGRFRIVIRGAEGFLLSILVLGVLNVLVNVVLWGTGVVLFWERMYVAREEREGWVRKVWAFGGLVLLLGVG